MNIDTLVYYLSLLGLNFPITEESSPIILFAFIIFILSILALLAVWYIILYLCFLYISENKKILDKISQYSWGLSLLNLYKKLRLIYLIYDVIFLLFTILSISRLCWKLIYGLSS